ncbi:MAG: hypothetical protein AAGF67_04005 [Verrucomicrobiota bacterium]
MKLCKATAFGAAFLSMLFFTAPPVATAQESPERFDPFAPGNSDPVDYLEGSGDGENRKKHDQVALLLEYYEVSHLMANRLLREFAPRAAKADELRARLVAMTESGEAELVETGWLRSPSGQRAKSESIREEIYPTEFDRPMVPESVGEVTVIETTTKSEGNKPATTTAVFPATGPSKNAITPHISAMTPVAFETMNVGLTLEVDPVIGAVGDAVDISIAPEIVERIGTQYFLRPGFEDSAKAIHHVSMPKFYLMRTTTECTLLPGRYSLLALHAPHDKPDRRIIGLIKATLFHAN